MEGLSFESLLIGFGVGLALCIVVYAREMFKRAALRKEIKSLKGHLHTKLDIDAEASEMKKQEIDKLKKEAENLRISLQTLSQKTEKKEVVAFQVYQRAIDILAESLVGFSPAWQKALRQAEQDIGDYQSGSTSFIKKFLPPNLFTPASNTTLSLDEDKKEGDET